MRTNQYLEDWMHWERVLWQRSKIGMAVMLDARCEDEERDAEHRL